MLDVGTLPIITSECTEQGLCHDLRSRSLDSVRCRTAVSALRLDGRPVRPRLSWAAGAGRPVILLHAGYLDRRMWDPQFLLFARSFRVVRYDARGFGRSGPADAPYSFFEDLYALIRALELSRVTLVGASLGGAASLDFAVTHPEMMVEKLVLVGPGLSGYVWPREDLNQPWRVEARAALAKADTVGVALAWAHSGYLLPASVQPPVAAKLRTLLADNVEAWKTVLRHHEGYDTAPAPPALERLAAIHAPVLLIVQPRRSRYSSDSGHPWSAIA